jgi:GT2 family glycosyltransferase
MKPRRLIQSLNNIYTLSKDKGLSYATQVSFWKIRTATYKRRLKIQDQFALYPYQKWILDNEVREKELIQQRVEAQNLPYRPRISVIVVGGDVLPDSLKNTLNALLEQTYNNWNASLVLTSASDRVTSPAATDLAQTDERIHLHWNDTSSDSSIKLAMNNTEGEFIIRLYAGDKLSPNALFEVAKTLNTTPDIDIIYSDQDCLAEDGYSRQAPFFKPDWSPELMLSTNYLACAFIRKDLVSKIVSKNPPEGLASFEDLIFRCSEYTQDIHHIPHILYHRRHETQEKSDRYGTILNLQAEWAKAHLDRLGIRNVKSNTSKLGTLQMIWPIPERRVSIIIPTQDNSEYLKRCITSIQEITEYTDYEFILVDCGSQEEATQRYYSTLSQVANVHITKYQKEFNFSSALNFGASHAQGGLLLFLNNDTEAIEPYWLEELVRWAEQPNIGIVGAKLLFPDGAIQHAGIVVGMEGHGSHVYAKAREGYQGPFGSVDWYRNCSAVTAACMMMRREVFNNIGGFDENYELVFSDIEICQRAIKDGYRILYTPFARLIHHEGLTRHQHIPSHDIRVGYEHLKKIIEQGDPFYNPNLSYSIRMPTLKRPDEESPIERLNNILSQAQP